MSHPRREQGPRAGNLLLRSQTLHAHLGRQPEIAGRAAGDGAE